MQTNNQAEINQAGSCGLHFNIKQYLSMKTILKSTTRSLSIPAVLTASFFLVASNLNAATILLQDDFESYDAATTPTNPGDGNANNWYFHNDVTTKTIQSESSLDGWGDNEKTLKVVWDHVAGYKVMERHFEQQTSGILTFETKFKVDSSAASDEFLLVIGNSVTAGTFTGSNTPMSLRMSATNLGVQFYTNGPGEGASSISWNPQGSALINDTWYQLLITANLDTKTYSVTVTNLATGVGGTISDKFFLTNNSTVNTFLFRPSSTNRTGGNSASWTFDDVQVTWSIPEPSIVSFLLLGVLGLSLLRNRNRQ